jgi:hypothetical protein
MTSPTSATSSSTTGYPFQICVQDANASVVDTTARDRLSPPLSPTTVRLISAVPEKNHLEKRYQEARQLIQANPEAARGLFIEIIAELSKTETDLLFLADCKLGLASTYPEDDDQSIQIALDAKKDLDQVCEERSAWDSLDEVERAHRNKHLRASLREFEHLVPDDMTSLSQIEECTCNIPLLSDFYDMLRKGVKSLRADQTNQARTLFAQALRMIEKQDGHEYLLAQAFKAVNHVWIFGNSLYSSALTQALEAYQWREELYVNDQLKLKALNLFCELFYSLKLLTPASSVFLLKINEMLEECQVEIALLRGLDPEAIGASPTNDLKVIHKVTEEPADPCKATRLFITFGCDTFIISSTFAPGQRYIIELNFSK